MHKSIAASHRGHVRRNNEDYFLDCSELGVWAVCDGVGGNHGGEVASIIACEQLQQSISEGYGLEQAIVNAHQSILEAARNGIGGAHMKTTIVALQLEESAYRIAWVGDSRAYGWNGQLHQLTEDHSVVQKMLNEGLLREDEVKNHPHAHVITQALGSIDSNIEVDCVEGEVDKEMTFLLCSDGLTGMISDNKIAEILRSESQLEKRVDKFIDAALTGGGKDNVTTVLIEYSSAPFVDTEIVKPSGFFRKLISKAKKGGSKE